MTHIEAKQHPELKEWANRKRLEGDLWLCEASFIIQFLFVRFPAVKCLKWPSLERNRLRWQWFEVLRGRFPGSESTEKFLSHSLTVHDDRANTLMLSNSGKTLLILCYKRVVKALLKGITQSQHCQQLETGSFYGAEYRINNTVFTAVGCRHVVFFLSLEHAVMSSYTVSVYRKQSLKHMHRNTLGF